MNLFTRVEGDAPLSLTWFVVSLPRPFAAFRRVAGLLGVLLLTGLAPVAILPVVSWGTDACLGEGVLQGARGDVPAQRFRQLGLLSPSDRPHHSLQDRR